MKKLFYTLAVVLVFTGCDGCGSAKYVDEDKKTIYDLNTMHVQDAYIIVKQDSIIHWQKVKIDSLIRNCGR
jgi:hypothetical protein